MLALSENLTHGLFIAGIVLITMALMMRLSRRKRGSQGYPVMPVEMAERAKQAKGMRGDLESLMVEIEQLAKRLGAQLDVKAMRLEKLLREADERIDALQRLPDGGPAAEPLKQAVQDAGRDSMKAAATLDGAVAARRSRQAVAARASSTPEADPGPPNDPLAQSVYKLADAGHTSTEIARQLNEHVGKVELILALRQSV